MRQRVLYQYDYIRWYFNGNLHRDKDLPAVYYFRDEKLTIIDYCQHHKYHRTTGPAVIDYENKLKEYFYQSIKYVSLEEIQMVEACK